MDSNSAESIPVPKSPASPEQAVSLEPVEIPASQEQDAGKEGTNQNAGMPLPTVQPTSAMVQDAPTDESTKTDITVVDAPPIADDVDVIEKEWVDKAKQIVDNNREDPYTQNKEVSALKADYMQKRYGKEIKLTED